MKIKTSIRLESTPELLEALEGIDYRASPSWLGTFGFRMWTWKQGPEDRGIAVLRGDGRLPCQVWNAAFKMAAAYETPQIWNTLFVQRYEPGQNVKPHRDPRNNTGETLIGLVGTFRATLLRVEDRWYAQEPGDVFVLPCTIAGKQGPVHEMEWPEGVTGTRYAIILNTIERS
jgi:hypothetical protein